MSLLRSVTIQDSGPQKQLFFKRFENGGIADMNVNGSVTPVVFSVSPPAGEVWRIASWSLYVQDGGTFDAEKWGNGITMTNGLLPILNIGGTDYDMLEFTIKTSGDLSSVCDGLNHLAFGTGDEIVTAEWDFISKGQYVRLTENDSIKLVVQDDLTGLVKQYSLIKGYKE
jgi:hypothetical protein